VLAVDLTSPTIPAWSIPVVFVLDGQCDQNVGRLDDRHQLRGRIGATTNSPPNTSTGSLVDLQRPGLATSRRAEVLHRRFAAGRRIEADQLASGLDELNARVVVAQVAWAGDDGPFDVTRVEPAVDSL
jgi:hypothetical protein